MVEKSTPKQKLYAYVDESGQDIKSSFFVAVTVVSEEKQDLLRQALFNVERLAKTGNKKWHKLHHKHRIKYLEILLEKHIAQGNIFYGYYKKPILYYFPIIEVLEKPIKSKAKETYKATVCVDGIDKKKAAELTNTLRARGISLGMVKRRRDESDPLLRLVDMWAGCIRGALLENKVNKLILQKAQREHYLCDIRK